MTTSKQSLYAAVLAAGASTRFGETKQLARFDHQPLVRLAVRAAEAVCNSRTLLVVGHDWQRVHRACAPLEGFLVRNEHYRAGMASSLAVAVKALPASADGLLIALADQPLVDSSDLSGLAEKWRPTPDKIAVSRSDNVLSPPVIFPRSLFGDIRELDGDRGAREVIERH
ncbi:MAG: nucleotidyltransferase family protein, partial [Woeseiaceae bacterium]|nr:nucleotidyltransferase family protein [Woeseiaceae bacterium]